MSLATEFVVFCFVCVSYDYYYCMSIREIWQPGELANGPVFSAGSERLDEPKWWTFFGRKQVKVPFFLHVQKSPIPFGSHQFHVFRQVVGHCSNWDFGSSILSATHHRLLLTFLAAFSLLFRFLSIFFLLLHRCLFFHPNFFGWPFVLLLDTSLHPGVRSVNGFAWLAIRFDFQSRAIETLSRELYFVRLFFHFFSPRRHVESTGVHSWQNWK